jgi:hypothetical protein
MQASFRAARHAVPGSTSSTSCPTL